MSRARHFSIVALVVFALLALTLFSASASAQSFKPHRDNDPPVYNFKNFQPNRVLINGTYVFVGPQYVTPAIIWGIVIGLFLLSILYVALSCLMSVQRPVRMSAVPLVLAKEY